MSGGLSLCIQGTRESAYFDNQPDRFIPVHTGNTFLANRRIQPRAVYPCAYREHKYMGARSDTNRGLSLCIQGTQRAECDFLYGARFIPVYTENPQSIQGVFSLSTVYPCAYREHTCLIKMQVLASRFIPVHTGNTEKTDFRFNPDSVYPCAYREHIFIVLICTTINGLSLCIQGTPTTPIAYGL